MLLNDIKLWRQRRDYDCLVACCKMVLDYLGINKDEHWLRTRLAIGDITPFPNIKRLTDELGMVSVIAKWGEPTTFEPYIEAGLPVIVAVDTDSSNYWPYVANHAVVMIGFNNEMVFVHDPNQRESPLEVDIDTFMLAWSRRDFQYAIIQLITTD